MVTGHFNSCFKFRQNLFQVFCNIPGCKDPSLPYSGNTTNLAHHIQMSHPKENAVLCRHASGVPVVAAGSITNFFPGNVKKLALTDKKAKEVTNLVVDLFTEDLRPFNLVNGGAFGRLMARAFPDYPLASRTYYEAQVCNRYSVTVAQVIEKLRSPSFVSITADLWTSMAHHCYLGINAHYVEPAGKLQRVMLDCVELPGNQHTAVDIGHAVIERFQFWELSCGDKVHAAVIDNGANMWKAMTEVAKFPLVIGCFSHTVNLAVVKGLDALHVSPLVAKAKDVVSHFSRSTKDRYELRDRQKADGGEIRELVTDVPTRWTSTYDMIVRLLELKDFVYKVMSEHSLKNICRTALSAEDSHQLAELRDTLQPLCLAMQGMGGEQYASLSLVLPMLERILNKILKPLTTGPNADGLVVQSFKKAAYDDLVKRYQTPNIRLALQQVCKFYRLRDVID